MDKYAILIIDDDEDLLAFLKRTLHPLYEIYVSSSAHQGLNVLERENINLIICDVMMPQMDGFTFCRKIKNDLLTSHIPVILLTAKNNTKDKIEGLESNADVYMEKPFSKHHLIAQIESLLANRSRLCEHFLKTPAVRLEALGVSNTDNTFFHELNKFIQQHLDNPQLGVEMLSQGLHMSRATLYRKITTTTNLTPSGLINVIRLKAATTLLLENHFKINEIATMTGFYSASSFCRCFQKQFKCSPKQYLKQVNNLN